MSVGKVGDIVKKNKQIKSRQRVVERGEVYTAEREVKAMCDLVKDETNRIDSRFLEPACGNGNFLAEILTRKLDVVRKKYGKSEYDYERYSLLVLCSIYGVDIMSDNVQECRDRLYKIWNKRYTAKLKKNANEESRNTAKFILSKNILCGDALTMKQSDGTPITFAEWTMIGDKVKRRDYTLSDLLEVEQLAKQPIYQDVAEWDYDAKQESTIVKVVNEYPIVDILEVANYA